MLSMIRQHAWTGLVAAAALTAALAEGFFAPLGFAAAAMVVWSVVAVCLIGRVFDLAPIGQPALIAGLLLAAATALTLLSALWAKDQGDAFEEGVRAALYLGLFTLAACTAREDARRRWVAGLAAGLAIAGFLALLAYLQPGTLDSGRSEIPNAAGRLSYPIGYWNGAASMLAVAAVLLAFCAANAATRLMRTLATAAIPAMVLGIWLTSSRGGLIALGLGWAVMLAATGSRGRLLKAILVGGAAGVILILFAGLLDDLTSGALDAARRSDGDWMSAFGIAVTVVTAIAAWRLDGRVPRIRISRRLAMALLTILVLAGGVAIAVAGPEKQIREFTEAPARDAQADVGGVSSNGRWQWWKSSVDAFESSPAHGVGAGGWEAYWGAHSTFPQFARNPHSLPMQSAAELGVPGIALLLSFMAVILVAAVRRLRLRPRADGPVLVGVLATAAAGAAVDWTWQIPGVIAAAVVCAGLLTASAPPRLSMRRSGLGVLTLVVAYLAIAASALVLVGDVELRRSRDAADAGNFDEAIRRARDALTFTPWASDPYTQLALSQEDRGSYGKALADIKEAEARDADDWRLLLIEARLQTRNGNTAAAETALRRAQANSPFFPGSD
jgi:O-Antigen ligase